MNHVIRRLTGAGALVGVLLVAPAASIADEAKMNASDRTALSTEVRGRPPFQRQRVSVDETADFARFEETAAQQTRDGVRVVSFRGRPPYQRRSISVDETAEFARFEETAEPASSERRVRLGPPGKMSYRR